MTQQSLLTTDLKIYIVFRKKAKYLAGSAILLAVLVLIGWQFDIEFLKRPIPKLVAMNPFTAIGFLFTGASLLFLCSYEPGRFRLTIIRGLATIPILLGLFKITYIVLDIGFQFDTFLFREKIQSGISGIVSNGLAPNTAFNFIVFGTAIILSSRKSKKHKSIANYMALIVLLSSLFVIVGYLYKVPEFYSLLPYIPMAIHTAAGFIIITLALFFINADVGFMEIISSPNSGGTIARVLIPATIFLPILMGYIGLTFQWNFPISVELGVDLLITCIVILFFVLILYISFVINKKDILRKEAEHELNRITIEKRFQALIENSFDVIALYDNKMQITYLSPSFERLTGFTLEERKNSSGLKFAHPDDHEKARLLIESVLKKPGIPIAFQNRILHKSGSYLWVEGVLTNLLHDKDIHAVVSNYREITERKREEEELITNEQRFRALIENGFEAISLVDKNGEILHLNPSAERLTGFAIHQRNNVPGFKFVHAEDLEQSINIFEQALNSPGISIPFQSRQLHSDGYYIWIEGVITNLLHDKNVNAIVSNYRDITERKRQEEELEESNRRLYNILESIKDGFYACDKNWIIRYWNKAAEDLFGTSREHAIGKYLWDFFPGSSQLKAYTELNRTMNEGVNTSFEEFYGDTWFSVNTYPSKEGISVFFRDITENKRLEKLYILEKNVLEFYNYRKNSIEDTITMLLNGIRQIHPEMLCSVLKHENGKLYNWSSPHLPKGYNDEVEGISIGKGGGSCGTAAFLKNDVIVSDILTDPLWKDFKGTALRYDLKACWSHVIMDDHQNVSGTFATYFKTIRNPKPSEILTLERGRIILKNIIENNKAEKEILKLNVELEERVTLRTAQLQEANKELEAFSYSVSHDLRAPLRSIHGYGNILIEDYNDKLDNEAQKILGVIISNAQKMAQLIDDLLDFSKLGRTEIRTYFVNMNEAVKDALEEIKNSGVIIPAQIQLNDLQPAQCDANLIKQVWINLLSNAFKYSSLREKPEVEIGMAESKNGFVTYYVKDNGAGFDMQYYNKLFGVFQRLHSSSEFSGTGVGLAIVHRILERHGGSIWAEAEVNKGATFYFRLDSK